MPRRKAFWLNSKNIQKCFFEEFFKISFQTNPSINRKNSLTSRNNSQSSLSRNLKVMRKK
ncbi:hypothetical protein T05_2344 [Trichinella murrelli]|uniref:Uncharacterized protein n=1 Tax=Trichinella murrelli TaxID=144512 RepID=A0A0V0U464_9BILA|nr:hypothetical protein T05_2344 [Trichinella murrelli]